MGSGLFPVRFLHSKPVAKESRQHVDCILVFLCTIIRLCLAPGFNEKLL